ncbi:MAG: M48 family metalloprotease [Fimbriimonadaceae bacterium]|jgi:hypothetical protein|nr:M48 family metalloprotease [Fimbriimonadaceae bacterium]
MKMFLRASSSVALLCLLFSSGYSQTKLGESDIQKMITELEAYIPRQANYVYPIQLTMKNEPKVNAFVTVERTPDRKFQAVMVVFEGLLTFLDHDKNLVRAVIAHEMAHLSKGHPTDTTVRRRGADMMTIYTRQLEYEADRLGAQALVSAGYNKMDMVEVLIRLSELSDKSGEIALHMTGTHADGRMRAAAVNNDDTILLGTIEYKAALGFMQARDYGIAAEFFAEAYKKDSRLKEALIMQGQASLMNYYDLLPDTVKEGMFKPDFGPVLPIPVRPKGGGITAEDQLRYAEALKIIRQSVAAAPTSTKASELLGLALMLHPTNDRQSIESGRRLTDEMLKATKDPLETLRLTNNSALGLARLGQEAKAAQMIRDAFIATGPSRSFNMEAAENMARVNLPKLTGQPAFRVEAVLRTYLTFGPVADSRFALVKRAWETVCRDAGIAIKEIENQAEIAQITSMTVDGKQIALLQGVTAFETALGKPATSFTFSQQYPDIIERRYKGGDVVAIFESERVFRVTSYAKGSSVQLRAKSPTSSFRVTLSVGMKASEIGVDLKGLQRLRLVRGTETEIWNYLPGLNIAVFSKDGATIDGISVLPSL